MSYPHIRPNMGVMSWRMFKIEGLSSFIPAWTKPPPATTRRMERRSAMAPRTPATRRRRGNPGASNSAGISRSIPLSQPDDGRWKGRLRPPSGSARCCGSADPAAANYSFTRPSGRFARLGQAANISDPMVAYMGTSLGPRSYRLAA